MNKKYFPYFNMYVEDESKISFEHWTNDLSVGLHRHNFHELLLIDKGTCRHIFNQIETLLIPGDVVVIEPHKEHGFMLTGEVSVFNCQFNLSALDENVSAKLINGAFLSKDNFNEQLPNWEDYLIEREELYKKDIFKHGSYELNSNKQRVIHLPPNIYNFVSSILRYGLNEQQNHNEYSSIFKRRCLDLILIEIKRSMKAHINHYKLHSHAHQKIMAELLLYIDSHFTEQIDFNELATKYAFSANYFRKLFRDVTGFSPINYLNRLRIIRSCEYIQHDDLSVSEAAEKVGIYDLNYFSRLFKKIMGIAPSRM